MKLECPSCETTVAAMNISLENETAKCNNCDNIFHYSIAKAKDFPVPVDGDYYILPKGIEMYKLVNRMDLFINWRKTAHFFSILFSILWLSFMTIFTAFVLFKGNFIGFSFTLPFWAPGLYLFYKSFGYILNETIISVSHDLIEISHAPIKFLAQKDKSYNSKDIQQFFVVQKKIGTSNGKNIFSFSIYLHLKNGIKTEIISNFKIKQHAQFVEREIENYLGIKDVQTTL